MRILLALALALPAAAFAGTYKWVDEKGVVNYSNSPPPSAGKAKPVEDRVSSYETDPELKRAILEQRASRRAPVPEQPRAVAVIGRQPYGGCTPPHFFDCPVATYGPGDYYQAYAPAYRPAIYTPTLRRVVVLDDPTRRERPASLVYRSRR